MLREKACSILGISSSASEEDIKKAYKKLAVQYHPDKFANVGEEEKKKAEERFKEINQAYQLLTNKNNNSSNEFVQDIHEDISDFISSHFSHPFSNFKQIRLPDPIVTSVTIEFFDSVRGCKKEIEYERDEACATCKGSKVIFSNEKCKNCDGKGSTTFRHNNMFAVQTCPSCKGAKKESSSCNDCNGIGTRKSTKRLTVTIPGGIQNEQVLGIRGQGNFSPDINGASPVHVTIHVKQNPSDPSMHLSDDNVISGLNLTLLEALSGTKKHIETVSGIREIEIPKGSRHRELIKLPNLGVRPNGNHVIVLNVEYPKDVDKLINFLQGD